MEENTNIGKTDKQPWEMQEGESAKAFEAFTVYRDLGPNRSFTKAGAILNKSNQLMSRWASAYKWQMRVMAWDAELDRIKRELKFKEIEDMHQRHAKHAQSIETSAMVPIQSFLKKVQKLQRTNEETDFDKMNIRDLFKLVKDIAHLMPKIMDAERKSRGEPTDINSLKIDLSKLSDDELKLLANNESR